MTEQSVGIIDSTLREGEQTPGVAFTDHTRQTIIAHLYRTGIDEIELGIASPVHNHLPQLVADARTITSGSCRLALWSRCMEKDISFAGTCRPDTLSLSIPVSDLHIKERLQKDRAWVKQTLTESIRQGIALNIPYISVGLEDGSRADPNFLLQVARIAEQNGAQRIRLADTVGICSPAAIQGLVQRVKASVNLEVGVHCHNDFGMATANSIAAMESGADWLDATVLGLGERAGNCCLEEVVGFMGLIRQDRRYRPERLPELCRYVADVTGISVPGNHPIVGEHIFTCETGLHQHGLAANPGTYEPYEPRRVGTKRTFRFGRKTGTRAVNLQLAKRGVMLDDTQLMFLTRLLRTSGQGISEEQLAQFAANNMHTLKHDVRH